MFAYSLHVTHSTSPSPLERPGERSLTLSGLKKQNEGTAGLAPLREKFTLTERNTLLRKLRGMAEDKVSYVVIVLQRFHIFLQRLYIFKL